MKLFCKYTTERIFMLFLLIGITASSATILNSWAAHDEFTPTDKAPPIPSWIKNVAGWWADNQVTEIEFIEGITYLINNRIIVITDSSTPKDTDDSTNTVHVIPAWIKNNAGWWADGDIPDSTFISGLQWLISNKIMQISVERLSFIPIEDVTISRLIPTDKHDFTHLHSAFFETYVHPDSYIRDSDGTKKWTSPILGLNPYKMDRYNEIALWHDDSQSAVVVYPLFTATAYSHPGGFYDYFAGECDSCTTTTIKEARLLYTSSGNGIQAFELMGYDIINDIILDKNPDVLERYDKVIMLHNEYVTRTMFDAVTSHPKVIYLYPNALYAEIDVNYIDNTITLIRGHDYPPEDPVSNGFDWEFDNTHPFEYDNECDNMELYPIKDPRSNMSIPPPRFANEHWMLNCYPDLLFSYGDIGAYNLLKAIKDL